MSKVRAKTVVNDGWKQPKKRKPMTPEQKAAAAERLKKARAAKPPAKKSSIHPTVLAKGDEHFLSAKNVQSWIKNQKEQLVEYRHSARRDIKGAKAQVANCEGYIRHLQYYLRHGDYCDDRYGAFQEKRIKWQTIVPKG
tara:strand:+ start:128 stop:544 length:417 start_codon:yes stop_codon:yes gene_type:complete